MNETGTLLAAEGAASALKLTIDGLAEELRQAKERLRQEQELRIESERALRESRDLLSAIVEGTMAERQQADAARRESEELLSTFLRHSPILAYIKSVTPSESRFLMVSDSYREAHGMSGVDLVGKTTAQLFPPELAAKIANDDWSVVSTGQILEVDADMNGRNYTTIKFPIVQGSRSLLAGYTIDITERKRAEAQLAESHELFASLARMVPGVIYQYRLYPDGRSAFPYCSPGMVVNCEITPEEVREDAAAFFGRIHPDDRDHVNGAILESSRTLEQLQCEFRVILPQQGLRWRWMRAYPERTNDGGSLWHGTMQGITKRKMVEESLRAAKETAENATRAKEQFLARLSHELRTPLTPVILAAAHWQTQPNLPTGLADDLAMMCRNLDLEARMLEDLLDVNRIMYGKLSLRREVMSVHQELREAMATVAFAAQTKRLGVNLQLQAGNDRVDGDTARVQQIFLNLLNNAIKFTPEGGSIIVSTANEPDGQVRVQVTDSGVGIERDLLPRLFQPFEQGSEQINRQYGGMGLGLSICSSLARAHGGTIAVDSEGPGKGATFTVRLPLAPAAAQIDGAAPQASGAPVERSSRILLVEDNADTARMLGRLLRAKGYAVEMAGDVASALERVKHRAFDLLISDLGLPDGSGLDLMRQLRGTHPIRGIAVSGYGTEDDLRKSRDAGFEEHLVKPISFSKLLAAIERVAGSGGPPRFWDGAAQ